ncbi:TPA: WbqC family protein, partial [Morganella morganii subsp. morganii]|nr:WbqC family protein [Morganella morganii subsp. morganii]
NNKNEFVPYMSIIDLISNIGIEKSKEYIRKGWSL